MKKFLILSIFVLPFLFSCEKKKEPREGEIKAMYQCPMHPEVIQEKRGDCPICGMKLVERRMIFKKGKWIPYEEIEHEETETETPPGLATVSITPEKQQLIGVKTEIVKKKNPVKSIRTVGRVEYDETKIYTVNLKFGGWIEKLYIDYTGKFVKKGMPLFDIYSPEILQAQQELISAKASGDSFLIKRVKKKLLLWDLTLEQIDEIEKKSGIRDIITILSPYTGFVVEKNIFEGMKVNSGMNLYKIVDLSTIWVYGEIYEYELPFVKKGQVAELDIPYIPGKKLKGKVSYIYPDLNKKTRTITVRLEFYNPSYVLKPGMYVNLNIYIHEEKEELVIPEDAILFSGKRNYVFIKKGKGTFEPRIVELGPKVDKGYIVLKGIEQGEEIVTSANFLIDSESKIKAAISGMTGHQH